MLNNVLVRAKNKKQRVDSRKRLFLILLGIISLVGLFIYFNNFFINPKSEGVASAAASVTTNSNSTIKTVCLDPGHGGNDDPGEAIGDLVERDINLIVANNAKLQLEAAGYKVVMTRTSNDAVLDNSARAAYCNTQNADILVSIHQNGYDDDTTDYATTLYYKDSDQALAQSILDTTSATLNVPNNGLQSLEDNVLAKANMPAALSEALFVSSSNEAYLIDKNDSTRLADEASGIVKGIENYFAIVK